MSITETAPAAFSDDGFLTVAYQVGQDLTVLGSRNRADRHDDFQVLGAATVFALFGTTAAGLGNQFLLVAETGQGVLVAAGRQDDIAAVAAVAAVRAAPVDELLMTKTDGTIAAVSCCHRNFYAINKHMSSGSKLDNN